VNGETPATVAKDPEEAPETRGFVSAAIHRSLDNVRAGDVGSWPIIIGLAVISAFFYYKNSNFLSGGNLNNIITQMAGTATIASGLFFVLLLGEIDLAAGFVSGIGGVVVGELTLVGSSHAYSGLVAIPIALLAGALYGLIQGLFVAYVGVPSFVVTLAGMLAAEGLIWHFLNQGVITIQDKWVNDLDGYFFSHRAGWIVAIIVSALYALAVLSGRIKRHRAGAETGSLWSALIKIAAVAVLILVLVDWTNHDSARGLPLAFVFLLLLYSFWNFISMRTTFGRHVYAVGGNAEAARRAGINVPRIKLIVFVISGVMASLGGIVLASRLRNVDLSAGSGTLLFDAIAGVVIGGTSLFGGRGRVTGVVVGVLLIMSIDNGLDTVGYSQGVKYIVTGLVLVAAVTLDTVMRKRQEKLGR